MTPDTLPNLTNALRQLHLLSFEQLERCARELEPQDPDSRALAREMVRREWLTPYQVNELFQGRGEHLLLGSYVLLDKVGEGGMGTVFKARNWKLDKLVALKVIKKDRLLKPDTIKRFYREIRAVAQLDHPNIVRAFDADEVNETHFFVMEYVEGTDLSKLVKSRGPLPFALACEYMRQAALGLQHAFERGLVHRDIKPHNLLLASGGRKPPESSECSEDSGGLRPPLAVVKILDMGLALIETPTHDDDHSSTMTHSGIVMGTPDYMAPEQSMNAHTVDIRADLYSLGCTLHFLLTGRPPFAGGTLAQKLMRHQMETPESLKKVRPDVPNDVESLVLKLLAKQPEQRYQTPRELAEALVEIQANLSASSVTTSRTAVEDAPAKTEVIVRQTWAEIAPAPAPGERPQAPTSRLVLPITASLMGLLALGIGIWWATRPEPQKPDGPPVVETKPRPSLKDGGKLPIEETPTLPRGPATDEWVAAVRALPPNVQAAAVFAKLSELNEGFLENHEFNGWDGTRLTTQQTLTDLSPVRALEKLTELTVIIPNTQAPAIVSVADLSPLKGLPLKKLDLSGQRVADLSPLSGMPLTHLSLSATRVKDLGVIPTLKSLAVLNLSHTPLADLGPLASMKSLDRLDLTNTQVTDLRPLAKLSVNYLHLAHTDVSDLTPIPRTLKSLTLRGCPVEDLSPLASCADLGTLDMIGVPFRSLDPLNGLKRLTHLLMSYDPALAPQLKRMPLKFINHVPVARFWKWVEPDEDHKQYVARVASLPPDEQVKAAQERMRELNPEVTVDPKFKLAGGAVVEVETQQNISDLSFLTPFRKLEKLTGGSFVNLEPLRGLPLRSLSLAGYGIVDISPLAGMPLETLELAANDVEVFEPLRRIPTLRSVTGYGRFYRLTPLAGLPLSRLGCAVNPRDLPAIKDMKSLETITLHYDDFRHREALKAMTWLKTINHKPAAEFWNGIAEEQVKFVRQELNRLNPGFEKVVAKIEKGAVTNLGVHGTDLRRLDPIRTLTDLHTLIVRSGGKVGELFSLEPIRGLPLLRRLTIDEALNLKDFSALRGMPLEYLRLYNTGVDDFTSLERMPLKELSVFGFNHTAVADLNPLRNMPLIKLNIGSNKVSDLTPLGTLKDLKHLSLGLSKVSDLTPLGTLKDLKHLFLALPLVKNLRPLQNLSLEHLDLNGTNPESLAPLQALPLKTILSLNFEPFRDDADVLRAMPKLEMVNYEDAKEFIWKRDKERAAFDKWCGEVAKLPAKELAQAVETALKNRNPEFTGTMTADIDKNQVVGFNTPSTVGLRDITPLRAFPALRQVQLGGDNKKGDLANLYPLRGLPLEHLRVFSGNVMDLTPLRDMKTLSVLAINGNTSLTDLAPLKNLRLTEFNCSYIPTITDLSPLAGMKLSVLIAHGCTSLKDLSPLRGMPLRHLSIPGTSVSSLLPLKGMPLESLTITGSQVKDYRLLRELSLKHVDLDFVPWRDSAILRSLPSLMTVHGKPAKKFHAWADWEDAVRAAPLDKQIEMIQDKFNELHPGAKIEVRKYGQKGVYTGITLSADKVTDLSPARAFPNITFLLCIGSQPGVSKLKDLTPLSGLPLEQLTLYKTEIADLSPLQGMPLRYLNIDSTKVTDLSPLRGSRTLQSLRLPKTVTDLSPLKETALTELWCHLDLDRDAPILKAIKTLMTINDKPVEEVLK